MLPWNPSAYGHNNGMNGNSLLLNNNQQQQQQQTNQQQNGQQGQTVTLATTLHFLQSEHRRYARDRNEWEIERAELRARIALLEGEKRGHESTLRDLSRRCRMLEVALKTERSKNNAGAATQNNASTTNSGVASPNANANSGPGAADNGDRNSVASSDDSKEAAKMSTSKTPAAHLLGSQFNTAQSKARTRDYLKQVLQEITYLTSEATLNPLAPTSHIVPSVPRPRKTLNTNHAMSNSAGSNSNIPGLIHINNVNTKDQGASAVGSSAEDKPPPPTYEPAGDAESEFVPLRRELSRGKRDSRGVGEEAEVEIVENVAYNENEEGDEAHREDSVPDDEEEDPKRGDIIVDFEVNDDDDVLSDVPESVDEHVEGTGEDAKTHEEAEHVDSEISKSSSTQDTPTATIDSDGHDNTPQEQ